MANVLFKRGLQSNLASQSVVDGAFYLTTDTHRLYMGYNGGIHQVNPGITKIGTMTELEALTKHISAADYGQFYYVEDKNILCIYNGTKWVQINPDTDTDTFIKDLSATVNSATGGAKVDFLMNVYKKGATGEEDTGKDITGSFTIKGNNGVSVAASNGEVVVSGPTLSLNSEYVSATEGNIVLNGTEKANIKVAGSLTMSGDENSLTITGTDTNNRINSVSVASQAEGFKVSVSDDGGKTVDGSFNPTVKVNSNTVKFVNGEANLTNYVYDKNEIDSMLRGFQAMEYQGQVSALPTTNVKVGYMYVLTQDITTPITAKAYDTVIARGSEGTNGYISGTITWDLIPSGDDISQDTLTLAEIIDNGFKLKSSTGSDIVSYSVAAGTAMSVSDSSTASTDKVNVVTIAHANVESEETTGTAIAQSAVGSAKITAVTGVTVNEQGHVTGVEKTEFSVVDTNGALIQKSEAGYVATTTSSADRSNASVNFSVQHKNAKGGITKDERSLSFATNDGKSLQLSAKENKIYIDLVWEEF